MKNSVKLLDCTLRDGAYLVDKRFGEENIRGIIAGLVKARVDYIEIGFLQDEGFGEGKTVFRNSADASRYVPQDKGKCEFTLLADCSRYSIENLDVCTGNSIDAIRECFFKYERDRAIENCRIIKSKGYKLFVQPVDILGYSDVELIELIEKVNEIEPYCFSIVDTFGSMYPEDLHRVFEIIHHNLNYLCCLGFHSHNNMQMSNALSQEFIRMSLGKRKVIVDGTIAGMGRGAGNTPTELVAQYMVNKMGYSYDIDTILDIIDNYIDKIRVRCDWGYTTSYFVAGSYGAHVNNVLYLTKKNSIRSKDIRYILNTIGIEHRKRYDYDLLEKTYVEYLEADIDDSESIKMLQSRLRDRNILIIAPGSSIKNHREMIIEEAKRKDAIVISINGKIANIDTDYIYFNNAKKYTVLKETEEYQKSELIITSNIELTKKENAYTVSFTRLLKCGWTHVDNSMLMLLRLLDIMNVKSIAIAGFDGYSYGENYVCEEHVYANIYEKPVEINNEIQEMLDDYMLTRKSNCTIRIITPTRFLIER